MLARPTCIANNMFGALARNTLSQPWPHRNALAEMQALRDMALTGTKNTIETLGTQARHVNRFQIETAIHVHRKT